LPNTIRLVGFSHIKRGSNHGLGIGTTIAPACCRRGRCNHGRIFGCARQGRRSRRRLCSDLEARVAELEATTVRKGNKKVSVTLYGQVNKAVLWWDDDAEKNTYVVDNNYESSRFGFKGSAKIGGDWSAGYRMEIETITAQSNLVNQFNPGDDPSFGLLNVRHSYMYLDNKKWGQVRWGLTATPIYNITKDTNVTEL
jgi:Gram-negative porin